MNTFLWVLQIALALLAFAGGAYKATKFDEIASQMAPLSRSGTRTLGVLEMTCAVLLVVPAAAHWIPTLTPMAAVVLALESLALAALYARHSLRLTAANPLVWSVAMALVAAFVAYGRYEIRPLA